MQEDAIHCTRHKNASLETPSRDNLWTSIAAPFSALNLHEESAQHACLAWHLNHIQNAQQLQSRGCRRCCDKTCSCHAHGPGYPRMCLSCCRCGFHVPACFPDSIPVAWHLQLRLLHVLISSSSSLQCAWHQLQHYSEWQKARPRITKQPRRPPSRSSSCSPAIWWSR